MAVVVSLLAVMLVLTELGVSVAPILGAAGVAGLAVGFGAQSLVKDCFTGLFLLLEDQIHQGDVVRLGERTGLVEEMTSRYVRLRGYDGHVHFVPNGQIAAVVNLSRGPRSSAVRVLRRASRHCGVLPYRRVATPAGMGSERQRICCQRWRIGAIAGRRGLPIRLGILLGLTSFVPIEPAWFFPVGSRST